ncbi:hypothetical protein [Luteitalea sp.]
MPKLKHGGLTKRCDFKPSQWVKCAHSWVLRFHHDGIAHVVALHKYANWPSGTVMPKTEAARLRDQVKDKIRAGKLAARARVDVLTVGAVMDEYERTFVDSPNRRPHARVSMAGHLNMLRRLSVDNGRGTVVPFTSLPIGDVTPITIEAVRHARRAALQAADAAYGEVVRLEPAGQAVPANLRQRSRLRTRGKAGETGINRLLARLRHLFSWAIARYDAVQQHPFRKAGVTVVKLEKETHRSRRLRAGEEDALLRHANYHLKAVIIAALTTGARIGELLSLQWRHVERDAAGTPVRIRLVAEKTKTARTRVLPVPTPLRAILQMRETAPDGVTHGPDAYCFGNEVGERV